MTEQYPYTGEDIHRATGGYVKSGLLRMWISDGRLKTGARAKNIRGGPRTFDRRTVIKAALMAELRKHGVSLPACQDWAEHFIEKLKIFKDGTDEDALRVPFYYVIKPDSGTVFPISGNDITQSLFDFVSKHGPTILIVDILGLIHSVAAILDASGPADESEGPETDANEGEVA